MPEETTGISPGEVEALEALQNGTKSNGKRKRGNSSQPSSQPPVVEAGIILFDKEKVDAFAAELIEKGIETVGIASDKVSDAVVGLQNLFFTQTQQKIQEKGGHQLNLGKSSSQQQLTQTEEALRKLSELTLQAALPPMKRTHLLEEKGNKTNGGETN